MSAQATTIRKIGLRQFNREMYKEIKDLPIVITKDREPYLVVMSYPQGLDKADPSTLFFANDAQLEHYQQAGEEMGERREGVLSEPFGNGQDGDAYIGSPLWRLWQRIKKLATIKLG